VENNSEMKTTSALDAFLARAHTRKGFLKAVAAAGVGAAAGSALLTRDAEAQAALSDVELLNLLLPNEIFESEVFYPAALNAGILSGEARAVVAALVDIEAVHRDALIGAITSLGGTPAPAPRFVVPPGILANQTTFLRAALEQEIKDVGANLTVGALLRNPNILAAAGAIGGQEGENVVAIKNLLGVVPPANDPFPQALSLEQAQAILAPFIAAGGSAAGGGGAGGGGSGSAGGGRRELPRTGGPGA
jgi:ferritin-like protein